MRMRRQSDEIIPVRDAIVTGHRAQLKIEAVRFIITYIYVKFERQKLKIGYPALLTSLPHIEALDYRRHIRSTP